MHQPEQHFMVLTQPGAHRVTLLPEWAQLLSQNYDFSVSGSALERNEQRLSKIAAGSFTIFDQARNLPNRK